MVSLTAQEKDVVDRFNRLPPERKRYVMLAMVDANADGWRTYQAVGEEQLRKLAAERGLHWDSLDDERRQAFATELLHGDPA